MLGVQYDKKVLVAIVESRKGSRHESKHLGVKQASDCRKQYDI